MKIERFEDIKAWQKAREMNLCIYNVFKNSRDFGFKDQILTKLIESPKAFKEVPTSATWYEDSITSKDREGNAWSYKQIFARMGGKIIYSEQCIAEDLCLTMKYIGMISKQ